MGEVYRADDLKLRQPVALKFLPAELSTDARRLDRFHNEVRVARQVSHPNVCSVYDIGETDGQHFISMEYVDGEDLASLLRRIDRPSVDKAAQIARQLCAGLAAAHEKGVLHRDLKPHNVMIDGLGKVRITDFGLAGFIDQLGGGDNLAGTPAYMAPEQLAGKSVSIKSDIYALGLVLYELFTGKRAHKGTTNEIINRSHGSTVTSPSSIVEELNPAVERVILRCLEVDPGDRPSSALAVAAALPGGDPLAAALAAGETPSPEMVAMGGGEGLIRPRIAVMLLAIAFTCMVGLFFLSDRIFLTAVVPLPKTPEQLAGAATDMLTRLGFTAPFKDSEFGFEAEYGYLEYLKKRDTRQRWKPLNSPRPFAMTFWYRQSPVTLKAIQDFPLFWQMITADNPPPTEPGMIGLRLDPQGRLIELLCETEPFVNADASIDAIGELDWNTMFDEAGLDLARFNEATAVWRPSVPCNRFAAWTGTFDNEIDVPVRVEAAALDAQPVAFRVLLPWHLSDSETKSGTGDPPAWASISLGVVFLAVFAVGAVMAWRNYRLGKGDRRGALRLAILAGFLVSLNWLKFGARLPDGSAFLRVLVSGVSFSVFWGAWCWAFYLAAEPVIRKHWPARLTSWTRLLAGRWRDPLVGRDVLIGATTGTFLCFIVYFAYLLGQPTLGPGTYLPQFQGEYWSPAYLLSLIPSNITWTLFLLLLILLVRAMVRRLWLAIALLWAFGTVAMSSSRFGEAIEGLLPFILMAGIYNVAFLLIVIRFGLLTAATAFFTMDLASFPGASDLTAWQAAPMLTSFAVIAVMAILGFYTSLAGRPLFPDAVGRS